MTTLPDGWRISTLGEIGDYHNGRAFKKSEWSSTGRPIIRIQNLTGSSDTFNYFEGHAEERHVARPGDLLISWAATLGAYIWDGPEAVINQHIFKVASKVNPIFHKYLLDHKLDELRSRTRGSGMVHITRRDFNSIPVPIPPLDEQYRIVDQIDEHWSALKVATSLLDRAQHQVKAWRASAIEKCISVGGGKDYHPLKTLLREPMRNGRSDRIAEDPSTGTRCLTLTAVTQSNFSDVHTKLTATPPKTAENLWLETGDIFVQRSNTPELVGTTARYDGPHRWAIFPDLLIRIRCDKSVVDSQYLATVMQTERVHQFFRSRAKGLSGSMPKIDQETVGSALIPVPSIKVQHEIVLDTADVVKRAERMSDSLCALQRRVDSLRRSILDAAFEGRLNDSVVTNTVKELARV